MAQAEFTFNSMVNRSTDKAPFEIVYAKLPSLVMDLRELPIGVKHRSAEDMANQISQLHKDIRQ